MKRDQQFEPAAGTKPVVEPGFLPDGEGVTGGGPQNPDPGRGFGMPQLSLRVIGTLILFTTFVISASLSAQSQPITGTQGAPTGRGVINMKGVAMFEKLHNLSPTDRPVNHLPAPMPRADFMRTQTVDAARGAAQPKSAAPAALPRAAMPAPAPQAAAAVTPPPANPSFQAIADDNTAFPPDAGGAVGPNHVMTVHNNYVRVQDRNGNILSTMTLNAFWMGVGADNPNTFAPKVLYDPYNDRWIFSAGADRATDLSSILVAVSQTGDPTGLWNRFRVDADASNLAWADYPTLGFNKDWIVVTVNMNAINPNDLLFHPYFGANIYVFSKTNLYANGDGRFTVFQDTSLKGFTITPAITYDNELSTLYLLQVENLLHTNDVIQPHAVSRLQVSTITGPVGAEVLDLASAFTPTTNAWLSADNFFSFFSTVLFFSTGSGPQLGGFNTGFGFLDGIDLGDTRLQDVVYRNGSLWTTHTIFEPVDASSPSPFHSAVQWWQLNPNGDVQQLGRIEDPAGTNSFAYPSIAVNRCNDVMIGYNSFSATQYVSANYSFRSASDPPNTMQPSKLLKAGEAFYFNPILTTNGTLTFLLDDNRWGDYSSTVVDPVNDLDMWTLQEYAAMPPTNSFGFTNLFGLSGDWATWWGRLDVVGANTNQIVFSATAYTVNEATPGFATITVGNAGGQAGSVDYATSDGTAVSGIDYEPASGTLVFAAGQTSTNFSFAIYDNPQVNPNKTVNLTLSNPQGGAGLGCGATAILTIIDNETLNLPNIAGEFVFSTYLNYGIPYLVTENETTANPLCIGDPPQVELPNRNAPGAIITVVRTNGSTGKILVDFSTPPGGSALPAVDYYPTNGTLVFDDFQTSASFLVPVVPSASLFGFLNFNFFFAPTKSVRVVLSNARPAPEEEQQRPGLLRPKIGNGSEASLAILPINLGRLATNTSTAGFTSWYNIERANYRTDEYSDPLVKGGLRRLDIDVTLFPLGGPGNVTVQVGSLGGPNNFFVIPALSLYDVRGSPYPIFNRDPDPSVKPTFNAGSDHAEAFERQGIPNNPANVPPFSQSQVWPNPLNTDPTLMTITNYSDYWPTQFNLGFAPGQCRKTFSIYVTNDDTVEFDEEFFVVLTAPANPNIVGFNPITTVTILYDDPPAGALDREWNPDNASTTFPAFNATPGADGLVSAVAIQDDGKTVLGGDFTHVNSRFLNHLARMNFDGSVDTTFQVGNGADSFIAAVLIYPTNSSNAGKILIAGGFTSYNGSQRNGIARVLPNGSIDPTFNIGNGADGPVRAMALQSDGSIVISGDFTFFNDVVRAGFARLGPDGSLDLNFDVGLGADGLVAALALQPDGLGGEKVMVAGDFITLGGQFRGGIARLNGNGAVDLTFDAGAGADGPIYALAVQTNRQVLMAGDFSQIDAHPSARMARLDPDGALDSSFDAGLGPNDAVFALTLQPDGKPLIGGPFTSYNDTRRMGLARLRGDGSLDTTFLDTAYNQFAGLINEFSFQPPNFVNSIALQADGNVMIGGSFKTVGGNPSASAPLRNSWTVFTRADKRTRYNIARLIGGATPGPGNVSFDSSDYFVDENAGSAFLKVERTDGRLGTLDATFSPSNHLATAGLDYVSNSVPYIWPEAFYMTNLLTQFPTNFTPFGVGQIESKYIQVPILSDNMQAGDKTIDLRLVHPDASITLGGERIPIGGAVGRSSAKLTIADTAVNHGVFNFNSPQYTTNENGVQALITVIRTNGSVGLATVDYFTRDSSIAPIATAGVDYTSVRGKLTFNSGVTSRTFTVPIIDDTLVEFDENIELVLTNATSGAQLPGGTPTSVAISTLTIIDNDFPPGRINFSASLYNTNFEADGFATITVTRSGGSVGFVSVQFQTLDGTAISPLDYLSTNGVLSWNDGVSTPKTFRVPLLTDGLVEGPETVNLQLFNPKVGTVSNPSLLGLRTNATLVILDSDAYGTVAFSQPFYQEDENGGLATITVTRAAGVGGTGTVDFATVPNTAMPGIDYVPTNGVLTFLPGEISKSFNVAIIDNGVADGNRALTLTLSGTTNVTLGVPNSVGLTIVDNESFNEPAGSADVSFRNPLVDGPIYSISLQKTNNLTDGRLIIAGDFTTVNHVVRNRLARLMTNGLLDATFDPGGAANGSIRVTAVQPDGRLLIGGFFTQFASTNRNYIARLSLDGKLDVLFNPGSGGDGPVYALALQPDGKILAGGTFSAFNSFTRPHIVRLNTNGTVDLSFTVGTGPNDTVYAVALQGDGKVLIGGDFTQVNGIPFSHLARLNRDGSVDMSFTNLGAGMDAAVRAILVQPDGKLVVGGSFTMVNGISRNYLARLKADGSLDASFMASVSGGDNTVYALARQIDGKLVVAGDFTQFNGVTRSRLTRLNTDGTTDPTINFGSGADGFVNTVVIQPDRKIVIGGGFVNYDDLPHNHIVRIHGGTIVGPGSLTFSRGEFQASESGGGALILVRRRGGTTGAVGASFNTADGTALSGRDYIATNGSLTFPNGETFQHFLVPIIDNNVTNEDRFLNLALSGYSGGATAGPQPVATLVIVNDESAVGFISDTFSVSESAISGSATITLKRSYATNNTVSALFSTINGGTATPFVDYIPTNLVVTFFPGEVLKNINVPILNNTNVGGNHTVFMALSNAVSNPNTATFVDIPAATLTIVNDHFAPGQFVFSSPVYSVNEYETNVTITVLRTNGSSGVVSVQFATLDGTAMAPFDYLSTNGTLAFADGETVRTFSIPIVPDYIIDTNKTVVLVLSNPTGGGSLGVTRTATLTILLNRLINGNLNFSAANYVAHESNQVAIITVTRSFGYLGPISVDYRTFDVTATNGNEYIGVTNTLTWIDGDSAPKTFNITLITNGIVEGPATVGLQIFNPQGGASLGAGANATLTILDDDKGPGRLGFVLTNYTVSEASSNAIIAVQRTFGMSGTVSIDFATSPGTAIDGTNYIGTNGTLFFLDGETNKSFAIPLFNSAAVENNKTVNLQLSNPMGGATTNGQIIASLLTIVEDQPQAGSIDNSFTGSGANDQIYSVVVLTNQDVVANNNKILAGGDFTVFNGLARSRVARLNSDGSLDTAFDAGTNVNSSVRVVRSQTDGNSIVGGSFTNIAGSALSYLARLQASGVIATNFLAGLSGADNFVFAAAQQADGKIVIGGKFSAINGTSRHFIARLTPDGVVDSSFNPGAGPDGAVRTLVLQTSDGKILIGGDFTHVGGVPCGRVARLNADGTLDTSLAQAIGSGADNTVNALAQQIDGGILAGGLFTNWNGNAEGRIVRLNADGSVDSTFAAGLGANEFISALALQADGKLLAGGGFTSFNGVPYNHLVRLNTSGTVDTSINFGSGANNYVSTIAVQLDHKIVIGGAFTQFNGQSRNYIARLNGGDNLGPGEFVFSSPSYSVVENGGAITVTVLRLLGSTNVVSVDFTTSDGTAIAGTHYAATNGTLLFGVGETIKTFSISVLDDVVTNIDRTVNLSLSNPTNLTDLAHPPVLGIPSTATLTIVDNDSVLGFSIDTYTVSESETNAVITVQRLGGAVGTVTVNYATSDGTATSGVDYAPAAGTLVFGNGQRLQTFNIPLLNDPIPDGNETVNLTLTSVTGNAALGLSVATLTIVDNVFSPGLLGFLRTNFTVSELAGSALITVVRSPGSSGAASVEFSTSDGTAIAGLDYGSANGQLVFADGEFTKTFSIPIFDDFNPAAAEPPGTINLILSNPIGAALGQQGTATLTILEDTSVFNFSATNYAVVENQTNAIITVTRSGGGPHPASVSFATSDFTALSGVNYVPTNGTLAFAPGQVSATFAVPLIDDAFGKPDTSFLVLLANPQGEAVLGATNVAVVSIADDDISFDFSSASYATNETAGNAIITVIRLGRTNGTASVNFSTSDGTAQDPIDYRFTALQLNFADGQTSTNVPIPIVNNGIPKGNVSLNLNLSNPTNATLLRPPPQSTLTIIHNEDVLAFGASNYAVDEGASNIVISVFRFGVPGTNPVTVHYFTSDGTATAGLDYTNVSGTLIFNQFDFVQTFSVPIIDDSIPEGDETVLIHLSNITGGAALVSPSNAVLTILDNDIGFGFSAPTYSVGEAGTNAVISVVRVGALSLPVSVRYASSDGTATAGADYLAVNGVLFFAPGDTNLSFTVPILDDFLIEGNETVNLRLFNPNPPTAGFLSPSNAVLTIVDNDSSTVIPAGSAILAEDIQNGTLDPGEHVTINFGLRDVGNVDTVNLVATLLPTNGVIAPSSPANYGAIVAGGAAVSRAFSFTVGATGSVTATLHLQDGARDLGLVTFGFTIGRARFSFTNNVGMNIPGSGTIGPASLYPSSITVSNVPGTVTNVTASLNNLAHTYASDIIVLLESPQTNAVYLMAEAGPFNSSISGVNLTFDDNAPGPLTTTTPIVSGTYKPSHYGTHNFDAPAPPPPYLDTLLALPSDGNANGTWSLFVEDDSPGDKGSLSGGWSLTLETTSSGVPSADLSVNVAASPLTGMAGQSLVYTVGITNHGPAAAAGVFVTNVLPSGVSFLSASSGCSLVGGAVVCNIGSLASDAGTAVSISVQTPSAGTLTDKAFVTGSQTDLVSANNSVSVKTIVLPLPSLALGQKTNSNQLVMVWPASVTNYNFTVYASDTLSPPHWVPLTSATPVLTGGGSQLTISLNPTTNASRFYRLQQGP